MTQEPIQSPTLASAEVEMLWRGNAIEAIKLMRVERNIGLKDAKDFVDDSFSALRYRLQGFRMGGIPRGSFSLSLAVATGDKGPGVGARRLGSQDS
jgi:hypothetical protein